MAGTAESLAEFAAKFRPDAAQGMRAVYQLQLDGDHGGTWHLTIADQQCHLAAGPADNPDVSIAMSVDDWNDLTAGRLDGVSAYLAGRVRISGDMSLVTQLPSLFAL